MKLPPRKYLIALVLWLLLTAGIGSYYGFVFTKAEDKSALLPGKTTHGHYQIELACDACHDQEEVENIFTTSGVSNKACNTCHAEDLEDASDSHPTRKFKNPENFAFLEHVDALQCITCHREHNEKITGEMGVTIPADYCTHCHQVTLENLPSHPDLPFNSCATSGCHNYHDNRALAPSFLLSHFAEPKHLPSQVLPLTDPLFAWTADGNKARPPLSAAEADAPAEHAKNQQILTDWHETSHAAAGINCTDCHGGTDTKPWIEKPDHTTCATCHESEVSGFLKGKHGMRLASGKLPPMTPADARLPMKAAAAHESLSCSSCHEPHRYDRKFAASQACISCHDDAHSKNFAASPHARLWQAELDGTGAPGTGVSCATCHLPREKHGDAFSANHNQNANLTPNEKMLQNVCMKCHGMQFAMDALADENLILLNFAGTPSRTHPGIAWTVDAAISRGDAQVIELRDYLRTISPPNQSPKPTIEYKTDTQ